MIGVSGGIASRNRGAASAHARWRRSAGRDGPTRGHREVPFRVLQRGLRMHVYPVGGRVPPLGGRSTWGRRAVAARSRGRSVRLSLGVSGAGSAVIDNHYPVRPGRQRSAASCRVVERAFATSSANRRCRHQQRRDLSNGRRARSGAEHECIRGVAGFRYLIRRAVARWVQPTIERPSSAPTVACTESMVCSCADASIMPDVVGRTPMPTVVIGEKISRLVTDHGL